MKKVILSLVVIGMSLSANTYYVGDKKAKFYYENPNAVNKLVKNGTSHALVLYYVKVRKNGKVKLSSKANCCSNLSLNAGQCFKVEKGL